MKAFVFALVIVSAFYFSEAKSFGAPVVVVKRDVAGQAELLAKLAALLGKSGGIVEMLEKSGKPLLAAGIKKLEDVLKGLEEKVKNANPHTEVGKLALKALDELIIKAEEKLEEELKKIQGTFYELGSQAELLLKLAQLLSKSKLAQDLLEKEGKPLLAAGIKKVDEVLHNLETKVKNANPKTEIGKLALKALDDLIIKAEEKLEEELKKVQGTFYALGTQAELLLKLAELLSKSKLAQELLEKEGKPLLAAGIKKVDELLHSLQKKVESANPKTEIGKLALKGMDELIIKAEEKLEEELKKIQGTFYELGAQAELLLKLAQLLSKSKLAQELLEKEGKPLLAAGIKKVDELLHSLQKKVESANPKSGFGKLILKGLDWLVKEAEHKLEDELKKITGPAPSSAPAFYEGVDLKDGLLKVAQELREKAKQAIAFLKAEGKSIEAAELQLLETVMMDIEKRLETLQPHTEIGKMLLTSLESLLKNAETQLDELLKKLNAHP